MPTEGDAPGRDGSSEMNRPPEKNGTQHVGLGFELAGIMIGCILLGHLYDMWQQTDRQGVLVGGVLGVILIMYQTIKWAIQINRDNPR